MGLCLQAINQWWFVFSEGIATKVEYLRLCLNMERGEGVFASYE